MKRVGYYLHEVAACLLPKGTGCIKPALTNPLCVHGCCMEVPVLRGNVRAYLRAHVTFTLTNCIFSLKLSVGECKVSVKSFRTI